MDKSGQKTIRPFKQMPDEAEQLEKIKQVSRALQQWRKVGQFRWVKNGNERKTT